MVVKKKVSLLISIILTTTIIAGCSANKGGNQNKKISIGITQIAEHPALDAAREGFIEALESKGYVQGENLDIEVQNAQGDIGTSQMISQNFVSQEKDLIFAIATPAAQAAFNSTKEIPIIVTAVSDPVKAGLVSSIETSNTNVAGTSDEVPLDKQFKLLKDIFPQSKKIGILYNTSEVNSEVQIEKAKEIAGKYDLEIITSGVTSVNDMTTALDIILDKVDVLYTLTDNLIASSMPLISAKAIEKKIPVVGAEEAHVKGGALITEGISYKKLGFEAGLKAVEVIKGQDIKQMSVSSLKDTELSINTATLEKLGVKISKDIMDKAKLIKGGE
ncbi:ABC transporter substrate-binding protein [Clostridium gasigenes]|uniref:ABC transporter substrate-binding protein n=1 Tax=Clostridium gasigenes TaxID=94869 RepID=UPI001C0AA451|nr:ABC transporter substrate-binding protein [Clostridium gasigenes]MBU3136097.1 ABC transporter substrate-binding protein [Clostridium gasigenes]